MDSKWICDTVIAAGELADEKDRYEALEDLRKRLENDTDLALELDNLLPIVDQWAYGLERYWSNGTDQLTGLKHNIFDNVTILFYFKERMDILEDGSCF